MIALRCEYLGDVHQVRSRHQETYIPAFTIPQPCLGPLVYYKPWRRDRRCTMRSLGFEGTQGCLCMLPSLTQGQLQAHACAGLQF
jgi:hypothetical protein